MYESLLAMEVRHRKDTRRGRELGATCGEHLCCEALCIAGEWQTDASSSRAETRSAGQKSRVVNHEAHGGAARIAPCEPFALARDRRPV
jgi:hypothetical protein